MIDIERRQARIAIFSAMVIALLGGPAAIPSHAQVALEIENGEIVIYNEGHLPQRAYRSMSTNGRAESAQWFVKDEVGNSYEACTRTCYAKEDGSWSCSGYSSDDGVAPHIVAGYDEALQRLVDIHGAVISHDPIMNVEYVSFPDAEDPYQTLVYALLNDDLNGLPLVDYFKTLEIGTTGPGYAAGVLAKPKGKKHTNPDDPFFGSQWNLEATRLFEAANYPFKSKMGRPVRIGIIDSGIDGRFDQHQGLDGIVQVVHRWTAETTGFAAPHAIGIATLLADAANDGDGIAGLLGGRADGCTGAAAYGGPSYELYSYNVGDFGPVSYLVARAITAAVDDGIDVINLSLRIASSPMVEQAIEEALDRGIVVVAAAGNYHPFSANKPTGFPASMDGVIAVSASGMSRMVNQYSANKGFDLVAPGERIIFGGPDDAWWTGDGTSYAAPHVTAAAALLKAAKPQLSSSDVLDILQSTGTTTAIVGGVFLDALAALKHVAPETSNAGDGCGLNKSLAEDLQDEHPRSYVLGNYPNPFNPTTVVTFSLPAADDVTLDVYDAIGRRVRTLVNGRTSAGIHEVRFDATELPSGLYYYSLTSSMTRDHGVMTLVR